MRKTIKLLAPILLMLAALAGGYALGKGAESCERFDFHRRHEMRNRMLEKMNARLELSPEQQTAIEQLLSEKREKLMALRKSIKPEFERIRESTGEQISAILSEDQRLKFEQMREEHRARRKQRRSRRGR